LAYQHDVIGGAESTRRGAALKKRDASGADRGSTQGGSAAGRRNFITKAGLAAAAAGMSGVTASHAVAAKATADEAIHWDYEVDVVVAGSGNGGMSAALATATAGLNTLLVEFSTQIGGNTLMSGGLMHTAGQRT